MNPLPPPKPSTSLKYREAPKTKTLFLVELTTAEGADIDKLEKKLKKEIRLQFGDVMTNFERQKL